MAHPTSLQPVAHLRSPLPVVQLVGLVTSRRRSPQLVVLPVAPVTSLPRLLPPVALPTSRKKSLQLAEVPAEPATNKIDITENRIFLVWPNRESSGFTRLGDSFSRGTADS